MTWGCKSPVDPARGTTSRTARVSTARWNLKEAAGKALARRTEIAYEAVTPGKAATTPKPSTCTEGVDVDAAGISVKVTRLTLGSLALCLCATHLARGGDGEPELS